MRRKVEPKELKYRFREHYLGRCARLCIQADFAGFYAEVAKCCGHAVHPVRIQRLTLAKRTDVMTATSTEVMAFAEVLEVSADQLTKEAGERVVAS